jgi:hypothetical protein
MRLFIGTLMAIAVLCLFSTCATAEGTLDDIYHTIKDNIEIGIDTLLHEHHRRDSDCESEDVECNRRRSRHNSDYDDDILNAVTIMDLCGTNVVTDTGIIGQCRYYLDSNNIQVNDTSLQQCALAYIGVCLTPAKFPHGSSNSTNTINSTTTYTFSLGTNTSVTNSFNPYTDEHSVFLTTVSTLSGVSKTERTSWTEFVNVNGTEVFNLTVTLGNCTVGIHNLTDVCVSQGVIGVTTTTGLTYIKRPPASRLDVINSALNASTPCVNWTAINPGLFTPPPTTNLSTVPIVSSDPTSNTAGNLTSILQHQLGNGTLNLLSIQQFIGDMAVKGAWPHDPDVPTFTYPTSAATNAFDLNIDPIVFSTVPLPVTMPTCVIDIFSVQYAYFTSGSSNVDSTYTTSSAYELQYPTCVQYTTCGNEYYTTLGPSASRSCWTMYCNTTIIPGQQYAPTCVYDDGNGGVKLQPPYSIFDMTSFGIFDWRYRPNAEAGRNGNTPNRVSYVNGIKDQAGCGSCWDFATTAVAESAFAMQYNLGVDSALVLPQLSKDGVTGNHYFASDLSEQHVLDSTKPYDECNHGGGDVGTALPTFINGGGVPLTREQYPASRNTTWNGQPGDNTYLGNQNGGDNDAKDTYYSYRPYAWGGTNYYASSGESYLSENQIRNYVTNEGVFEVYINACPAWGGYPGIGLLTDPTCGRNVSTTACNNPEHPEWCWANLGIDHAVAIVGYGTQFIIGCVSPIYFDFFGFQIPVGCNHWGPVAQNYWIVRNSWGFQYANPCYGPGCDPLFLSGGYVKYASGSNIGDIENELHGVVPQLWDFTLLDGWIPWIEPHNACFNPQNVGGLGDSFAQLDCHASLCSWNRTDIEGDSINNINSILGQTWSSADSPPTMSFTPISGYQYTSGGVNYIDYDWDAGGYCEDNKPAFCAGGWGYCTSINSGGTRYNTPYGQWSNPINIQDALEIIAWVLTFFTSTLKPSSATGACWYWIRECNPDYPIFNINSGNNGNTITPQFHVNTFYSPSAGETTTSVNGSLYYSGNNAYSVAHYPNGTVASLIINSTVPADVARALYAVYGSEGLLSGSASYSNAATSPTSPGAVSPTFTGLSTSKRNHQSFTMTVSDTSNGAPTGRRQHKPWFNNDPVAEIPTEVILEAAAETVLETTDNIIADKPPKKKQNVHVDNGSLSTYRVTVTENTGESICPNTDPLSTYHGVSNSGRLRSRLHGTSDSRVHGNFNPHPRAGPHVVTPEFPHPVTHKHDRSRPRGRVTLIK